LEKEVSPMSKERQRPEQPIDLESLIWDPNSFLVLNPDDETLRKLEMLRLRNAGYAVDEITEAFGCSRSYFLKLEAQFKEGGVQALVEPLEKAELPPTPEIDQETLAERAALKRLAWPSPDSRAAEWQAYAKTGGALFGLIFGLAFAAVLWVPHAYHLWRHSMALPWLGIIAGLALCGAGWAIAGCLAGTSRSAGWAALICAIAGMATPWLVWLAQMVGENSGWFVGQSTWGLAVHFGSALQTRLFFVGLWGAGLGAFIGMLERVLLPRAWDATSSNGRPTLRSVGVFLLCAPLALLLASVTDDLLQSDLQEALAATHQGLGDLKSGEIRRPFLTWNYGGKEVEVTSSWEWPRGDFVIHLVDYNADSMGQFFFDAVFDDGTTVRCQGGSASIQSCGNLSDTLQQYMENLVQSGLNQELEALRCETCDPYIEPRVIESLDDLSSNFTEKYEIFKSAQRGGTVLMVARFNTGYELTCRFRGEDPIVLDKCTGKNG
jgi:hypothetical protein